MLATDSAGVLRWSVSKNEHCCLSMFMANPPRLSKGASFNGMIAEIYSTNSSATSNDFNVLINWNDSLDDDVLTVRPVSETNDPGWFAVSAAHVFPSNRVGNTYFVDVTVTNDSDPSPSTLRRSPVLLPLRMPHSPPRMARSARRLAFPPETSSSRRLATRTPVRRRRSTGPRSTGAITRAFPEASSRRQDPESSA